MRVFNEFESLLHDRMQTISDRNPDDFRYGEGIEALMEQVAKAVGTVIGESKSATAYTTFNRHLSMKIEEIERGVEQEVRLTPLREKEITPARAAINAALAAAREAVAARPVPPWKGSPVQAVPVAAPVQQALPLPERTEPAPAPQASGAGREQPLPPAEYERLSKLAGPLFVPGTTVKTMRWERRLHQTDLAEATGLGQTTISRIERHCAVGDHDCYTRLHRLFEANAPVRRMPAP